MIFVQCRWHLDKENHYGRTSKGRDRKPAGATAVPTVGVSGEGCRGTVIEEGHLAVAQLRGRRGIMLLGTPSFELRPGDRPWALPLGLHGLHSSPPVGQA